MTTGIDTVVIATGLLFLPLVAALACFLLPGRRLVGVSVAVANLAFALSLAVAIDADGVFRHAVGGWQAPLGIELVADGLSVVMLCLTAVIVLVVSLYATGYFGAAQQRRLWPLLMLLLGGMNALFLAGDIFNIYVGLELVGLAAVALAALTTGSAAVGGAMRYLLVALTGSLAYLFGVALLYHGFGTVDLALLSERVHAAPVLTAAAILIVVGLIMKTALFPFHFWLPPAHASAPAPVSALLSALVVKASFYVLLRLWLDIFAPHVPAVDTVLGLLGAVAVIWGSLQALTESRVKLLVAYSTVAQIGYLFLAFPLAAAGGPAVWNAVATLMFAHALGKTAMFLAAGNLLLLAGHDRISELDSVVQRLPLTTFAFALGGISIIGLPPSGGFAAKWMLLEAAFLQGRWDLVVVMMVGSLLAAAYVFKVLGHVFVQGDVPRDFKHVPAVMEWSALLTAVAALLFGFFTVPLIALLGIGGPFTGAVGGS